MTFRCNRCDKVLSLRTTLFWPDESLCSECNEDRIRKTEEEGKRREERLSQEVVPGWTAEELGILARNAFVTAVVTNIPAPPESWTKPWDGLSEQWKQIDRDMGEYIARAVLGNEKDQRNGKSGQAGNESGKTV